jgi:opacity protein-like surface antigen
MEPMLFDMKKQLLFSVLATVLLLCSEQATAQRRRGPTLSFGGQVAQPIGEFSQQYDGYPAGLSGQFVTPLGRSPIEFGFGYSWNNMGSQNKDISALVYTDSMGTDIYEEGTLRIRSNTNRYQAIARFRPFAGRVQPYIDAFAGIEAFKMKTDITLDNEGYSTADNSVRQHLDMTYVYGWGAGLRVELAADVFLEGRFESITGGMVKYVDKESIQINDDNSVTFDTRQSATNKYTYQLGIAFEF